MNEQIKASFASASESSKQSITLATGLIGLEITFAKDLVKQLNCTGKFLIGSSWVFLMLSVVAGIWSLLAITGSLGSTTPLTVRTIYSPNIRIPSILQILLFLLGLLFTVIFGIWGLFYM